MSSKLLSRLSAIVDLPSSKQLKKVVKPYSDKELEERTLEEKIKKLMEFFDHHGIDYDKFKPEFLSYIDQKKAYPNQDQYSYVPGQHDLKKWLMAVKNIHYKQKAGLPYKEAIRQSTTDWKKMEIYDFLNWLRFYEEGTQMKYKFAQVWYENGQPGYFLHIKQDAPPEAAPVVDENSVNEAREETERQEEKKQIIEKQRAKIIGRLDSAEKLLRSPDGQTFAGPEMEQLMEAIYSLKKKVQLVNKLSVSTRLYEDMIVREANVLSRRGFQKAADMLYSVAQSPGQSAVGATGTPGADTTISPTPPPDPSGAGQGGTMRASPMAALPNTPDVQTPVDSDQNKQQPPATALLGGGNAPTGTAQSSPAIIPQEPPQPKGIKEFIENMNEDTPNEESNKSDDNLEVKDHEEELMVTEAQVAPPGVTPVVMEDIPLTDTPPPNRGKPANLPPPGPAPDELPPIDAPRKPKDEEPLEVTQDDTPGDGAPGFDAKMQAMLASVTIEDIVAELEDIAKDYKTRDMPRRLSIVDMMLNGKGISSYFPQLSEAQNKALEANNYISTRIDDIVSKLQGSLVAKEKDPNASPAEVSPEVADVKNKLQQDQDREKQRKQLKKQQQNAELEGGVGKEAPQVEMGELAPPAAPPAAAPARGPIPRPLG